MTKTKQPLNGEDRVRYGFITTWENEDGARHTFHRTGPIFSTLLALCDYVTALDPSLRLISYSTPNTIFSDLSGTARADRVSRNGKRQVHALPEMTLLARIGREELLHPSLAREEHPAAARRRRRKAA